MGLPVVNFGKVTVSTTYDAAATSIVLSNGHGSKLPATNLIYPLVWWNSANYSDPSDDPNVEVVLVTARSTDTLTVVRGQDGTAASTKNTGATYKMILASTAGLLSTVFDNIDNPIINPAMEVWQRGTSFAAPTNGTYTADRWAWETVGAGVVTISQSSNVPTVAQAGVLFNASCDVDVTTADASLAATDVYSKYHRIEGYNWRHYAQRAFTYSFWARDTKTGEHAIAFTNSGQDRTYVATYTINVADTWEYKTVNVSASPSAGTWNYTNGIGLSIHHTLAAGSNFNTTAGAWQTGNFRNTSTTVNSMDSTSNFFRFVGVKMELGSVATPLQFRSFQDELALCQRYYAKTFPYSTAPAQNAGVAGAIYQMQIAGAATGILHTWVYPVGMRATPTVISYNPSAANAQARNIDLAADDNSLASVDTSDVRVVIFSVTAGGSAATQQNAVHLTASAEL